MELAFVLGPKESQFIPKLRRVHTHASSLYKQEVIRRATVLTG